MPQPQPEAASASTLRELVGSLVRTDSAGARVISDAELEDLIPLLVLGADLSRSTPSPALLSKLTAFFERAGIDPRAPIPEVQGRLDAWLVQYPPSPEALRVLEEVLGGAAIAAGSHRGLRASNALGTFHDFRPVDTRQGEGTKHRGLAQFAFASFAPSNTRKVRS